MFTLTPLGDLTRFLSSNIMIKNEVYLITEDICIKSNGVLLAARSAKIEGILEDGKKILAVQFYDNITGLEDCLDLVYGGSVDTRKDNCKSIYKFGKLFQIREMMESVLSWIATYVTYKKFWKIYLKLRNLHRDKLVFVDTIKGYFSANGDKFMKHSKKLYHSQDKNSMSSI